MSNLIVGTSGDDTLNGAKGQDNIIYDRAIPRTQRRSLATTLLLVEPTGQT